MFASMALSKKVEALRARWKGGGSGWPPATTQTHDERLDLRGVEWPERVTGDVYENVDFSHSFRDGPVWLTECTFKNCRFTGWKIDMLIESQSRFEDCLFQAASFNSMGLGTSAYDACTFKSCRLGYTTISNPVFRRCLFSGTTAGVDFGAAGFWDCRFEGAVRNVWFRGGHQSGPFGEPSKSVDSGLHGVDFRDAEVSGITVSHDCALDDLALPDHALIVDFSIIDEAFLESGASKLPHAAQRGFVIMANIFRTHSSAQPLKILTVGDFRTGCGDHAVDALEVFRSASVDGVR